MLSTLLTLLVSSALPTLYASTLPNLPTSSSRITCPKIASTLTLSTPLNITEAFGGSASSASLIAQSLGIPNDPFTWRGSGYTIGIFDYTTPLFANGNYRVFGAECALALRQLREASRARLSDAIPGGRFSHTNPSIGITFEFEKKSPQFDLTFQVVTLILEGALPEWLRDWGQCRVASTQLAAWKGDDRSSYGMGKIARFVGAGTAKV